MTEGDDDDDKQTGRSMVEHVARAICESERMNPDDAMGGWLHWKDASVAAIRAMREPTDQMIDALWAAEEKQMQGAKGGGREMFIAAIDAALTNDVAQ